MLPQEDMVPRQCLKPILIIMLSTHQMRRLSVLVMLTRSHNLNRCSALVIRQGNSHKRKQSRSTSTSKIRPISTDPDSLLLIIAPATSWTQRSGTVQAGPLRETLTPIKIERNTENNSISQSHSTIEFWSRVQANCATRTWPTSLVTWEWPVSVEKNWITRDLKRLEEDTKMASQLILTTLRNEEFSSSNDKYKDSAIHQRRECAHTFKFIAKQWWFKLMVMPL